MSRNPVCFSTAVVAFMLAALCLCPLQAQQAPASLLSQRIQISAVILDVAPPVIERLDRVTPDGDKKIAFIQEAISKNQTPETTFISLQVPNDFPGIASTYRVISFSDKDHPGKNFVTLETSLEATPHIDGDIIIVKLKTMVTKISPAGPPHTIGQGITLPRYYLKNGVMAMLRSVPLTSAGKPTGYNDDQALEQVTFVTASILPASSTAR